jgi:hypothetical protein
LAFLHEWAKIHWPTDPKFTTHRQETPNRIAVQAFADMHEEELKELVAQWDV